MPACMPARCTKRSGGERQGGAERRRIGATHGGGNRRVSSRTAFSVAMVVFKPSTCVKMAVRSLPSINTCTRQKRPSSVSPLANWLQAAAAATLGAGGARLTGGNGGHAPAPDQNERAGPCFRHVRCCVAGLINQTRQTRAHHRETSMCVPGQPLARRYTYLAVGKFRLDDEVGGLRIHLDLRASGRGAAAARRKS